MQNYNLFLKLTMFFEIYFEVFLSLKITPNLNKQPLSMNFLPRTTALSGCKYRTSFWIGNGFFESFFNLFFWAALSGLFYVG